MHWVLIAFGFDVIAPIVGVRGNGRLDAGLDGAYCAIMCLTEVMLIGWEVAAADTRQGKACVHRAISRSPIVGQNGNRGDEKGSINGL